MPRNTFYANEEAQVAFQPNIGLDAATRQSVVKILNIILADESVLLFKTHRAEKHPRETVVPDLKSIFEAQCNQIDQVLLELVERINILGGSPIQNHGLLLDTARLFGGPDVKPSATAILADHEAFIRYLREDIQKFFEVYEDQGSYLQLVSLMRQHEKMAWTLRPYIEPEVS